ncbi:MAG: lipoprotein insertase outer membrane protein LolB [Candidatus Methylomirabilales bacterium]
MIPRWVWGAAVGGIISLAGCATLPPPREAGRPVSGQERDEILTRLRIREEQVRSLRGIALVEVTVYGETRRYREAVALRNDGRFRLETLSAFGVPVLIIASDGDRMAVRSTSHQSEDAADPRQLLARLLGIQLPPVAFVRLLAGLPPQPVMPSALGFYLHQRGVYLVEEQSGDALQRLYLDPSGALLGGEIWEDGDGLRFTFSAVREVEGITFPMDIALKQVRRPVGVTVTYQALDINPILNDLLFSFPLSTPAKNGG